MKYLLLIIIGIVGVWLGYGLAVRRRGVRGCNRKEKRGKIKRRKESMEKEALILKFLKEKGRVTNNNVEKLFGCSDASAERYLDRLESQGKIIQHGKTGRSVYYTIKNK